MNVLVAINQLDRIGFLFFPIGQLHQIAHDFYGIPLTIEELPKKPYSKEECHQFWFRLNFNNRDYMADRSASSSNLEPGRINFSSRESAKTASQKALASLSSSVLMQLFPFALVFRPDLKIISTGCQLKHMFSDNAVLGQPLAEVARLRRPKLRLTWENVRSFPIIILIFCLLY